MSENEGSNGQAGTGDGAGQKSSKTRKVRSDKLMLMKQVGDTNSWSTYSMDTLGVRQPTVLKIQKAVEKAALEGKYMIISRKAAFKLEPIKVSKITKLSD